MKSVLRNVLDRLGYSILKKTAFIDSVEPEFAQLYASCSKYSMTSVERMYALYQAVKYLAINKIEGDFVECGVWKGGSCMAILSTLLAYGISDRKIYLYDTYKGMTNPDERDVCILDGHSAHNEWMKYQKNGHNEWCYASIDEVKLNLNKIGYPSQNIIYVEGEVEKTIPNTKPANIALLRLDTDWFSSTYHELVHLFPCVNPGGVVILDDYGHWKGAKDAVDKYFLEQNIHPLLNRIDHTGRVFVKR